MKTLYMVGGTMGVGKTTVCQKLKESLDRCVFLDGDWCWDMHPFLVTEETKRMVMENICTVLSNYIACTAYDTIIFCWVMHEQAIIDEILSHLPLKDCRVVPISLLCSAKALTERIEKDIARGIRTEDVLERSLRRIPLYNALTTMKIDVSDKTVEEVVKEILSL